MTAPFTIAALSWASPATTARCLASWRPLSGAEACGQRLIYFQERTEHDSRLARSHGFEPLGDANNIGIGPAYRAMLDQAICPYLIFLECDWRLTHRDHALSHVRAAINVIASEQAALVRLRSRARPGWPVNPSQLQNKELTYPYWLLDSAYWEPRPERIFPEQLRRTEHAGEDWILAPARYAGWTNNPHVVGVEWLEKHVRPFMGGTGKAFEGLIDDYWKTLPIHVAQGRGLFTHTRIDGPGFYERPLRHRVGYPLRLRLRRRLRRFVNSGA